MLSNADESSRLESLDQTFVDMVGGRLPPVEYPHGPERCMHCHVRRPHPIGQVEFPILNEQSIDLTRRLNFLGGRQVMEHQR